MISNDVFISYSTKNSEIANHVRIMFESHGITCWMAPYSIPGGSNYTREIPYGIINAKLAVVIVSYDSVKSVWVQKEIEYALDNGIIVIPVILDNCDLKKLEEPFSNVVASDQSVMFINDADLSQLLLTVQRQLAKDVSPTGTNNADDLLQLGLRDIREAGGLLFDGGNAEEYLKKSAELGNATAMRQLAALIWDIGTTEEAEYWYNKAAEAGDIQAQRRQAARLYYDGPETSENYAIATKLLQKGVNENYSSALTLCAELLLEKINPYFNPTSAVQYLEKAKLDGNITATILMGDLYREGKYIQENPQQAYNCYCSVEDVSKLAVLRMGDCYFSGYGTAKDLEKAFDCYASNCYYNHEYLEKYADCLNYGYGTEKNKSKAIYYYKLINGTVGDIYELQDSDIHMRVLQKRVDLEDGGAEAIMGFLKLKEGKIEESYRLFILSNEHESSRGALGLGRCYLNGWGVPASGEKAFILFSRAFSMGIQEASKDLADCYKKGIGTEIDIDKAEYFDNVSTQDEYGDWNLSLMTKED